MFKKFLKKPLVYQFGAKCILVYRK